jgi:thiol-disulfide isomerase/thioredoxin
VEGEKMRDIGLWLLVGILVASVAIASFRPSDDSPKVAPNFALENLDGERVTLSSYLGKVVVLDFWATWCKPCVKAFPGLDELVAGYDPEDVVLLVVSLDRVEQRAIDYLVENGYPTDNVLWESMEASREVKALYGVIGIPHTFVIDRQGIIRFSGYPTKLTTEEIDPWL